MTGDALWMLTLDGHPPVPVTVDHVDGPTTHYRTTTQLPLNGPGEHSAVRATLTAPDGSHEAGVGSVDGVVIHTDHTVAMKVSFTAM